MECFVSFVIVSAKRKALTEDCQQGAEWWR